MDNLIIESIGRPIERDFSKTSVAHVRNAVVLADLIGADLITCSRDAGVAEGKKYRNIICSYASPYMPYKDLIQIIRDNPQADLWWFVNDHDLEDNILLRNVVIETGGEKQINMICNNPRDGYRGWILRKRIKDGERNVIGILDDFICSWTTLNLNVLIYNYQLLYDWADKLYGIIYYGSYRKWRLNDFLEYQSEYWTLSASSKITKKFQANGVTQGRFVDKLSWQRGHEELKNYRLSLYIEDEHTHDNYAYMANRFYESLMCNVCAVFDVKCVDNINKSPFRIPDELIVSNQEELLELDKRLAHKNEFEKFLKFNREHASVAQRELKLVQSKLRAIFT